MGTKKAETAGGVGNSEGQWQTKIRKRDWALLKKRKKKTKKPTGCRGGRDKRD